MITTTRQPNTDNSDFRFQFEELPILNEDGFSAGLVSGSAEITYWREDGYTHWTVGRIWLDGFRKATPEERAAGADFYITKPVEVEYDAEIDPDSRAFSTKLYLEIFGQLDGEQAWRDLIECQVNVRLADEAA